MKKSEMIKKINSMLNKANVASVSMRDWWVEDLLKTIFGKPEDMPKYNRELLRELGTIKMPLRNGELSTTEIVEILPNGVIMANNDDGNDNLIVMEYRWLSTKIVEQVMNYLIIVCEGF